MNSRERIELFLCNIKENTVIEASRIYTFLADDMTEAAFYKTLERFCQSGSLVHLTKGLYYKPKKSRFGIVLSDSENACGAIPVVISLKRESTGLRR